MGDDHLDVAINQLARQAGQPTVVPFREAVLDREVRPFNVAEVAHSRPERLYIARRRGADAEIPDPTNGRRLRLPRQPPAPRQQPEARRTGAHDELPTAHPH